MRTKEEEKQSRRSFFFQVEEFHIGTTKPVRTSNQSRKSFFLMFHYQVLGRTKSSTSWFDSARSNQWSKTFCASTCNSAQLNGFHWEKCTSIKSNQNFLVLNFPVASQRDDLILPHQLVVVSSTSSSLRIWEKWWKQFSIRRLTLSLSDYTTTDCFCRREKYIYDKNSQQRERSHVS